MQVSEISVGVSRRGDSLVHLHHTHSVPGHFLPSKITKHKPRSVTATDGHNKRAATCDGRPGFRCDECSSFPGDRIGIGIDFKFHTRPECSLTEAVQSSAKLKLGRGRSDCFSRGLA